MKIKIFICFFLICPFISTFSQINLVPNSSFEDTIACPNSNSLPEVAIGWSSYGQSPDYFNSCAILSSGVSVPFNFAGFQNTSTGKAYMGIQSYFTPGTREFIGRELSSPMIIGQKYYVSMMICCAFNQPLSGAQAACASNNIGILFSTIKYNINSPVPINNFAHINAVTIVKDTVNWVKINGTFEADSEYTNIVIGNFFDDSHTDTIQFLQNNSRAYYLIDDVCVTSDSLGCNFFDEVIDIVTKKVIAFPNPSNFLLSIYMDPHYENKINIYNLLGQIIYSKKYLYGEELIQIDVQNIMTGIYQIQILNSKNILIEKIEIIH